MTLDESLQMLFNVIEQTDCNGPTRRALEAAFRTAADFAKAGEAAREAPPVPEGATPLGTIPVTVLGDDEEFPAESVAADGG